MFEDTFGVSLIRLYSSSWHGIDEHTELCQSDDTVPLIRLYLQTKTCGTDVEFCIHSSPNHIEHSSLGQKKRIV